MPGTNGSGNTYTHNDFGVQASDFIRVGVRPYLLCVLRLGNRPRQLRHGGMLQFRAG